MSARVTSDAQPTATAGKVIPIFARRASSIGAYVHVINERLECIRSSGVGARAVRAAASYKLFDIALAAIGTAKTHEISAGWAARPGHFRRSRDRSQTGPAGTQLRPGADDLAR